jgi:hypothetical protein
MARDQNHRGLFEGMAFAISFQSKKPGETADQYSDRMEIAKTVEHRIVQAGGRVLANGFDELFEVSPARSAPSSPTSDTEGPEVELPLAEGAQAVGFTALIADGHSRKVKYMQALGLGLPCLATRWVTTCLDRGELVDWSPYLLCAGQSAFLGDAIRSRSLAPYDAAKVTLADVIDRRPRLLAGSRILMIMKKSEQGKKMPYVFLARVLGATVARVTSIDDAKARLALPGRHAFDWVYVDDKIDKASLVVPAVVGKKRKRGSAAANHPPAKKMRTLSNELVIQSLILGRLIGDGEMDE